MHRRQQGEGAMAAGRVSGSLPALAALLLAACTFGSAPPAPGPSNPSSASSSAPTGGSSPSPSGTAGRGTPSVTGTPSPPPRTSRRVRLAGTVRIPLKGQTYGRGLVLWGSYAAWVGCNGCERTFDLPDTLYVADLRTRTVRAVAATRGTPIVPVGGAGSVLVYAVGGLQGRTPLWSLKTRDLSGAAATTLAGARPAEGGEGPVAVVGNGQVAWQTLAGSSPGDQHGPVTAVDLRTGARRTLARDLPGRLAGLTRSGVVYRTEEAPDDALLLRPGREPLVLSETHDVSEVVADDTTVVWQTADGAGAAVWGAPLDGRGSARQYYRGGTGDRAVGTGFVALVTGGEAPVLLMFPLAGGPVAAVGDVPGEFDSVAADGDRLAYLSLQGERGVQPDAKHPIVLVTGTVELPTG
jgi:hypothetical protein